VETDGGTGTATYTAGDVLYSDASNSLAKLGVGSNGQVLTLAAGLPSWATPTSGTVTGSGTNNTFPLWNGTTALDDAILSQTGTATVTMDAAASQPFFTVSSNQNSGDIATVTFEAQSSTAVDRAYARINGSIVTNTNGAEDGKIQLKVIDAGTENSVAEAITSGFRINDGLSLRLFDVGESDYVGIKAPALTATTTYTLPASSGTAGTVLQWSASDVMVWDSVRAADLADSAVTTAKIKDLQVTTTKLAATSVTNAKVASNAIDSSKITDGTVSGADLKASAVTATKIANNSVAGTKIALGSDAQGDIMFYNGTDWARLAAGTANQFLKTQGAGANPVWADTAIGGGGGGGSFTTWLQAGNLADVSGTIGAMYKTPIANINSCAATSAQCITSTGDSYTNGGVDPFLAPVAGSLDRIRIKLAGAAVSTGTVGTPVVKIGVFREDYSTRTSLGVIFVPIGTSGVGTFSNTSADAFQTVLHDMSDIAVSAGDLVGWEFINAAGNDSIAAIRRLETTMEFVAD